MESGGEEGQRKELGELKDLVVQYAGVWAHITAVALLVKGDIMTQNGIVTYVEDLFREKAKEALKAMRDNGYIENIRDDGLYAITEKGQSMVASSYTFATPSQSRSD